MRRYDGTDGVYHYVEHTLVDEIAPDDQRDRPGRDWIHLGGGIKVDRALLAAKGMAQ